ncbi:MAG: pentapeptide repeat-containing protein, partial [Campylobacterota bacterium]|nr:pentapeptide repeat-containing protein [Campylobacterota bacterium]
IAQSKGELPTLQQTPDEKLIETHERIESAIEQLEKSEQKLLSLKNGFSHIAKIDTLAFKSAKAQLLNSKDEFSTMIKGAKSAIKESDEIKQDALSKIEKIKLNPHIPDEEKRKIDTSFLMPKVKVWSDYAFDFLCQSVKNLEKEPEMLHKLRHLGLAKRTIKRSWFGYNPSELEFEASTWAVDDEHSIKIPKGLVVPRFKGSKLISLRVVDENRLLEFKPTIVMGSDKDFESPFCYENETFPLFYFKSDIQARLCDQECYDICNAVVTDDINSVGDESKKLLKSASAIFYLEDDGSVEKLPNAIKFDTKEYKNLFEMRQNSIEIRPEVLDNLPKNISQNFDLQRDVSASSVHEKTKEFTDALKSELEKESKALKDELMAEKKEAMQGVNARLKKHGLAPIDESVKPDEESALISIPELTKNFDSLIAKLKKQNIANNLKIDDKIAQLENEKIKTVQMATKASQKYDDAQIKFATLEKKAKDPTPKWAKEMMIKAGIDPVEPNKEFTRELVIEYYEQNRSLAGKNLAHLDLSELQLKNINLKGANIQECNFSNSDLSGADLSKSVASRAKFSKTLLNKADISHAILSDAVFEKVVSLELKALHVLLDKTKLIESKFLDANFKNAIFKESIIDKCDFRGSEFESASFLKATIKSSYFDDSKMSKIALNECLINSSQFQHIESEKMLFNKSVVKECDFSHSKLYNMRILQKSNFEDSTFLSCNMEKSSIFQSSLKNCNFQQSNCSKMFIKNSSIIESDFRVVQAKHSRFEFNTFKFLNFSGVNMLRGSLRRTDLQECDFTHSNLYGVEFFKVQIYNTDFNGANLENSSLENRLEYINE